MRRTPTISILTMGSSISRLLRRGEHSAHHKLNGRSQLGISLAAQPGYPFVCGGPDAVALVPGPGQPFLVAAVGYCLTPRCGVFHELLRDPGSGRATEDA